MTSIIRIFKERLHQYSVKAHWYKRFLLFFVSPNDFDSIRKSSLSSYPANPKTLASWNVRTDIWAWLPAKNMKNKTTDIIAVLVSWFFFNDETDCKNMARYNQRGDTLLSRRPAQLRHCNFLNKKNNCTWCVFSFEFSKDRYMCFKNKNKENYWVLTCNFKGSQRRSPQIRMLKTLKGHCTSSHRSRIFRRQKFN